MNTRLFQEGWYMGEEGRARYEADMIERQRLVREWIETGPGRLSADEMMVLAWYREKRDAFANENYEGGGRQVDVLLVGNPGVVGMVNHQLDHIGAGLTSVSHGQDVADAFVPDLYAERKGWLTPPPLVRVATVSNRLSADEIMSDDMFWPHRGIAVLEGKAVA